MTLIEYGLIVTISIVSALIGAEIAGEHIVNIFTQVICGLDNVKVCILPN